MSTRDELLDEYGRSDKAPLGTLADLRAKLAAIRAEDLREARKEVIRQANARFKPRRPAHDASLEAADVLRRMADEAGKDTRKGESTRAASPWQQAVDGLNALVDAGISFHIEPDGHIANPAGDEHIEWDRESQRWRLVHDNEDAPVPDPGMTAAELAAAGPGAYQCRCGHGSNVHGPFCFAAGCDCDDFTHPAPRHERDRCIHGTSINLECGGCDALGQIGGDAV
ncbi:hypothetical protein A6A06_09705 [Streptomyces sp. CB02923]|uniref:hypothetical protein n=1 Tax=Streptomyces sp. CB02923 TaxID=1718985 RepID=UPI00093B7E9E|nr:hypothetical protein [Streptomyces sp. CB02923]OKI04956.1 hypothetical protein A6A06_09705 [Streptomyces sp. CB02923]